VAFSPNGKLLASTSRGFDAPTNERWAELHVWDVATGKERFVVKCHKEEIHGMAFSLDGKVLATASSDQTVKLWNVEVDKELVVLKERTTFKTGFHDCHCLVFSIDGKKLGAADYQDAILWELATERECASFKRPVFGWSPAFSPDLKTLASPNYQDVDLWDTAKGKERTSFLDHRGSVSRVAFTAAGKVLVAQSTRLDDNGKNHSEVKLWNIETGKEDAKVAEHAGFVRDFEITADAGILVLQEEQELGGLAELKILSLPTARLLQAISFKSRTETPWCLAISCDGRVLAAGCVDGTVRLWDLLHPPEPDRKDRDPKR
jgi:WD40 repeat protein